MEGSIPFDLYVTKGSTTTKFTGSLAEEASGFNNSTHALFRWPGNIILLFGSSATIRVACALSPCMPALHEKLLNLWQPVAVCLQDDEVTFNISYP